MVKNYWLVVAFAGGLALGLILAWSQPENARTVVLPKPMAPAPRAHAAPAETSAPDSPMTGPQATGKPPAPGKSAPAPATSGPPSPDPVATLDSGNRQAIDVGPVFREQFAEAQSHGVKNPLFDLHDSLEREARDDAWAYAAEGDIQNSLVAETSMGNFNVDHLECRATMCELRLSARGQQQSAALSRWHDGMRSQPLGMRLVPRASSSIGRDADADVLIIFTRPPKKETKD